MAKIVRGADTDRHDLAIAEQHRTALDPAALAVQRRQASQASRPTKAMKTGIANKIGFIFISHSKTVTPCGVAAGQF